MRYCYLKIEASGAVNELSPASQGTSTADRHALKSTRSFPKRAVARKIPCDMTKVPSTLDAGSRDLIQASFVEATYEVSRAHSKRSRVAQVQEP